MRLKNILALLVMAIFVASTAFAQEAAVAPKKEEKPKASITGQMFLWWAQDLTEESKANNGTKADSFQLKRVYVNYINKIDDVWSVRVTSDVFDKTEGDLDRQGYLFIKFAYIQSLLKFGPAELKVQYGLSATPIDDLTYKVRDSRWLNLNVIDNWGNLSANGAIDNSADMGIKADLNIMKMVTLSGMYANSEGYGKPNAGDNISKAYYGVLNITPIKGVYIAGFYKYAGDSAPKDKNYNQYMGGLVAYSTKMYKAGVEYINAKEENAGVEKESSGWDFFVNLNLKDLAGFPILVYGSYSMVNSDDGANDYDQTWLQIGLGYQFNDFIRTMITYEVDDNAKVAANKAIYIKTEGKF